jgi:hypothetical protein
MSIRAAIRYALVGVLMVAVVDDLRAESQCLYVDAHGAISQVKSLQNVPSEYRARAVCKEIQIQDIASPDEVKLGNDARAATFTTELGPMHVRWPRSIERCFSVNPSRAVGEAAAGVNRALKSGRFESSTQHARREWSLAFTDKATAVSQFPIALTLGGHPGFMIPPSQIYIIADFISPDCSGEKVADAVLVQVLLHEMGHVVEYLLMGERQDRPDRQRSEGFAAWFEQYSAEYVPSIPRGQVERYYTGLARDALQHGPRGFTGSAEDYAYAALQFRAIVEQRGIAGLMKVYAEIRDQGLPFDEAVQRALGWNKKTLSREMVELAEKGS